MIISASQTGNWVRIIREDGLHITEEFMPSNQALDIYHALHALFTTPAPLEPSESSRDP
jgi:hypothetical protein